MSLGWFNKLKDSLKKSSLGISNALSGKKVSKESIQELEDALILSDVGVDYAKKIISEVKSTNGEIEKVKEKIIEIILATFSNLSSEIKINSENSPHVVLFVGVNGSGKTTTIAKLAQQYISIGKKVTIAAGDTYRAAAIEQLEVWGEKIGCEVVSKNRGADPAAVIFQAHEIAKNNKSDLLLIDTAGRLQSQITLMDELKKIIRVIEKGGSDAPHNIVLTLDATIGQSAHVQVEAFLQVAKITGIIVTKLDGSAKGGVIVALADKFNLPIHAIGIGEKSDDLAKFSPEEFARALIS